MCVSPNDFLAHHGIKGQKWGIRRYQNPDGTLTPAGRERYYRDRIKQLKKEYNEKTPKEKRTENGLNKYIRQNYGDNFKEDSKIANERDEKRTRTIATTAVITLGGLYLTATALDAISFADISSSDNTTSEKKIENILNDEGNSDEYFDRINKDTSIKRIIYDKTFSNDENRSNVQNESLYVSTDPADSNRFKVYLGQLQDGSIKKEVTYKAATDLNIAKGKTLVNYSLEALGYDKSVDDISPDSIEMKRINNALISMAYKDDSGKMTDTDARAIKDKLVEEGFQGVYDYNDKDVWVKTPTIIFDSKDKVDVDKIKTINNLDEQIGMVKDGVNVLKKTFNK